MFALDGRDSHEIWGYSLVITDTVELIRYDASKKPVEYQQMNLSDL